VQPWFDSKFLEDILSNSRDPLEDFFRMTSMADDGGGATGQFDPWEPPGAGPLQPPGAVFPTGPIGLFQGLTRSSDAPPIDWEPQGAVLPTSPFGALGGLLRALAGPSSQTR
jgi:hypothetical protein